MTSGNNIVPGKSSPNMDIGYNNDQNMTYAGWELSEEDVVQYKDMNRRGLQFLFSLIRKTPTMEMNSPMNKLVSIYQKGGSDDSTGDFVIVSMAANNPNDIRVMEMTNEWFGEAYDTEPEKLIQKVIEMADGSGMIRNISEYGEYGKVDAYIETASKYDEAMNELGGEPAKPTTLSVIGEAMKTGGKNFLKALGNIGGGQRKEITTSRIADWFKSKKTQSPQDKFQMQAKLVGIKSAAKQDEIAAKGSFDIQKQQMGGETALNVAQIKERTEKYKTVHQRAGAEDVTRLKTSAEIEKAKIAQETEKYKSRQKVKETQLKTGVLNKSEAFKKAAATQTQWESTYKGGHPATIAEKSYSKKPPVSGLGSNLGSSIIPTGAPQQVQSTNVAQTNLGTFMNKPSKLSKKITPVNPNTTNKKAITPPNPANTSGKEKIQQK